MNTGDRDGKQLSQPKFWAIYEQRDNKKLQCETSYLKASYNIATIYRIYEKKKAILTFTSLLSIMYYFVSLGNFKTL